ncbi:hypothetical protein [Aeromicrobium chenweiae]|uniref:Uncharacterized protein n=1 Tax=Aeromicrobium chenweiae TaxID=2079793 RepID=A0A2S0WPK4_9ACTN|nr:hypothetical protein [Aeromicrobium chenweiae]AWB93174.1 hypothetical protein C3E78_13720 [Aeromicrobium chenweiae]TGN34164.1 hypothetical protein E4L97_03755 [Aeromicrobium chenweiae]
MTRLVAALAAVLMALAGCGGSSSDAGTPKKAATTIAPAVRTVAELEAALPRTNQVPGGDKKVFACPGEAFCRAHRNRVSVGVELEPSLTGEQVKKRYGAYVLPEDLQVTAEAWKDPSAAERAVAEGRAKEEPFVGNFATKGENTSETSYSFGSKGVGTIDDLTMGGWQGYVGRREEVLTNPQGHTDSGPVVRVAMHLWNGNTTLQVVASVLDAEERAGDAEALARKVTEEYIGRLG